MPTAHKKTAQPNYKKTVLACYTASITMAITNNLAPLLFVIFQDQFAVSFGQIGLLVLFNFMTQLTVDALCVRYADRIGYRPLIVAAHGFSAVGLLLLAALPNWMAAPYVGLIIATITSSIGSGLQEVLTSPIMNALPGEAKASSMSLMHSFYCWGHVLVVLFSTLLLATLGVGAWVMLPVIWAVVPIVNGAVFLKTPLIGPVAAHERMPLKALLSSNLFRLALLLMLCAGACELSMAQWASLFAEKGLGVSKTLGDLLGPCLFAVFMGVGRVLYGILGERLKLSRALSLCAALCLVCYLGATLIASPLISLLFCALTGFSVSLMWPGTISLSAKTFANGSTAMFGLLALGGDLGCSVGPWLTGLVSGLVQKMPAAQQISESNGMSQVQVGLRAGLLTAIIFPIALLVGVLWFNRAAKKHGVR